VPSQSAVRQSPPEATGFASLLAALTAPKPQLERETGSKWTDGLEDDVATLSYDRALRAHARYMPVAESIPETPVPQPSSSSTAQRAGTPETHHQPVAAAETTIEKELRAARERAQAIEQIRKRASVTLRMSRAERSQLLQRATEAGMTVSAYVRSCTLEVESLRAQVKQALAELRTAKSNGAADASQPHHSRFRWLGHSRSK